MYPDGCFMGEISTSDFSYVAFVGGTPQEFDLCAQSLGVTDVFTLWDDGWVRYVVGNPSASTNTRFRELFPQGRITDGTPFLVRAKQPPPPDEYITIVNRLPGRGMGGRYLRTAQCLRVHDSIGDWALALFRGGDWSSLESCLEQSFGAVGAWIDGRWVWYRSGSANDEFRSAFREGASLYSVFVVRWSSLATPPDNCLLGEVRRGELSLLTSGQHQHVRSLTACAQRRHISRLQFLTEDGWASVNVGEHDNALRTEFGRGGVPALMPLLATANVASAAPDPGEAFSPMAQPDLLFQCLVVHDTAPPTVGQWVWAVYPGGSAADLEECLSSRRTGILGLAEAVWAWNGGWEPQRRFTEVFRSGVPPGTALLGFVPALASD